MCQDNILLCVFFLHQRICRNLKDESDKYQRCSEITNQNLCRELKDSSLVTKTLETKIQVLTNQNNHNDIKSG